MIGSQCTQDIERNHSSVEGRFEAMLKHWVTGKPSWGSLIKALKSPTIEHGDIASKIESTQVSTATSFMV